VPRLQRSMMTGAQNSRRKRRITGPETSEPEIFPFRIHWYSQSRYSEQFAESARPLM